MKISELSPEIIGEYVHIDPEDPLIPSMVSAAASFVKGYTGLTDEELEEHEDITIAVMVLVSDMYDQRSIQVSADNINWTAQSILSMHATNYLPDTDVGDIGGGSDG